MAMQIAAAAVTNLRLNRRRSRENVRRASIFCQRAGINEALGSCIGQALR